MKKCSKGHSNPDDAIFCSECGEKIEVKRQNKECPSCHAKNPNDAEFCHNCGTSLSPLKKVVKNEIAHRNNTIKQSNQPKAAVTNNNDDELHIISKIIFGILLLLTYLLGEYLTGSHIGAFIIFTILSALEYGIILWCQEKIKRIFW